MINLAEVGQYIKKISYLTAIALDMEILIVNEDLLVIADWISDESGVYEKMDVEYIRSSSAITKAVTTGKQVAYSNVKNENAGCRFCKLRETCNADSLIAYPIIKDGHLYGAIGIYSNEVHQMKKLINQRAALIEYIENLCELIVIRISEEEGKKKDIIREATELIQPVRGSSFDDIIGSSSELSKVKEDARTFAYSSSSIMLLGESGTGKEIFANAIHRESKHKDGPFVAVNCAAIPDNLLESELFGYEDGSFTGARKGGRMGKFEMANGGTLFLDEIGEMPIYLQPKILRVLQERKVQRIGSNKDINLNIRIISATNRDLKSMIESGEFREDLYYRLGVIPLEIPSLRERTSDIPELAYFFLKMYRAMLDKKNIKKIDADVLEYMKRYDWPGNVRELQNTVEYAVNKCNGNSISMGDIQGRLKIKESNLPFKNLTLKEIEREAIIDALVMYSDTPEGKKKAAEVLGISRATLYRKIDEYKLSRD